MIYKIIVDKQPMSNPSEERKEYEIDIAPLYFKHDVYDSLVITRDEDYVMRRLELQDYNVLVELDPPVKEPLTDINIELFEGENYIYLYDMTGNKIVAQYLVKNEFNELYVLETEMHSAIRQSANEIELIVGGQVTTLDGAVQDINGELSLKLGRDENDQVVSMINASADNVTIDADKININGTISANGNFKVDVDGNMECKNAKISAFGGDSETGSSSDLNLKVLSNDTNVYSGLAPNGMAISGGTYNFTKIFNGKNSNNNNNATLVLQASGTQSIVNSITLNEMEPTTFWTDMTNMKVTTVKASGITTPTLTQTSLATQKENFEKLSSGLEIIKDIDIYKYNMKNEDDDTKKHIGFVIGDNYKYSKEVTSNNNEGVDIYSFVAVCCKAIQEQQEEIQELKARIEKLEKGEK